MSLNLRPNVNNVISAQVPAFFSGAAENFVRFVECYYEWLESDGKPLDYIRSILEQHDHDLAQDKFKKLIESGVLNNLPVDLHIDKSLLIKNIKQIFRSKGSEDSFRFLFNILYDENIEIDWGRDLYVKSSDSVYTQTTILALKNPTATAVARIDRGLIEDIDLMYSDYGFMTTPTVSVIRNTTDDAHANLPVIEYELSGSVTSVTMLNHGWYPAESNDVDIYAEIIGDCDEHAVVDVLYDGGEILEVILLNSGSGYKERPTIQFHGITDASASVEWSAVLGSVTVVDGKHGWQSAPRMVFVGGQGNIPLYDNFGVIINYRAPQPAEVALVVGLNGNITTAAITNAGENYQYKPSVKWDFYPDMDAKVEVILDNTRIVGFDIKYGGTNYVTSPELRINATQYDYTKLIGNRITQLGKNYVTAIVDNVSFVTINEVEYAILYLQKKGLNGEFNPDSLISATINGETIIGVTTPIFSDIDIVNVGSGYKKGQIINFDDTGEGGSILINEVSMGNVDEVLIAKSGHGYAVHDQIISFDELGKGFSAEVKTVDGIGIKTQVVMEIDEIKILDNGYGFNEGDVIYIYGGDNDISTVNDTSKLAKLTVETVSSSNDFREIKIVRPGSGYRYLSLAILPSIGSTSPLRQIRADGTSYDENGNPNADTLTYELSPIGSIKNVVWNLEDPDLNDQSISIVINGVNGVITPTIVDGVIIDMVINSIGINYVDPIIRVFKQPLITAEAKTFEIIGHNCYLEVSNISLPGAYEFIATQGHYEYNGTQPNTYTIPSTEEAIFDIILDEYGSLDDVVVLNGGRNYTYEDRFVLIERYGPDALNLISFLDETHVDHAQLLPVFKEGGLSGFILNSAGQFTELDKYGARKYTIKNDDDVIGAGLDLDIYYRPARVDILDLGKYYSNYTLNVTESHGKDFKALPDIKDGVITSIELGALQHGSGYTWAKIKILTSTGSGFVGAANIVLGAISTITVKDGGYNYSDTDTILILGDGTGAVASIHEIKDGYLKNITIRNGGSHYHYGCRIRLIPSLYLPTVEAVLTPTIENGVVTSINIVNGGEGYSDTVSIVSASWVFSLAEITFNVSETLLLNVSDQITIVGCIPIAYNGVYDITWISSNKKQIKVIKASNPGVLTTGGTFSAKKTSVEIYYLEEDEDYDNSHVFHGIGTYTGDLYDELGTDTYKYGATGTTIYDDSPIWPLRGSGIINTLFQIVDFVDLWPQISASPKNAVYNIANDVPGVITDVEIIDGGSGYFSDVEREPLELTVNGDGIGATATATAHINSGAIDTVTVLTAGRYYSSPPKVTITGDYTVRAEAEATITGFISRIKIVQYGINYVKRPTIIIGTPKDIGGIQATATSEVNLLGSFISQVEVLNTGYGYDASTTVEISGGSPTVQATAVPIIEDGRIIAIDIVNPGVGYTTYPNVIITGSGLDAAADVWIPCELYEIIVTNGGSGYDKDYLPIVTSYGGHGEDTILTPIIDYKVDEINVISGGSGYTSATVQIDDNDAKGRGAVLLPVLENGSFKDVIVIDGGEDYSTDVNIAIYGGKIAGTNAELIPIVENGSITRVTVDVPGTGYYYGTSSIVLGDGENCFIDLEIDTGITGYTILNRGLGYLAENTIISIVDHPPTGVIGGSGAKILPVIVDEEIVNIIIVDKGRYYYNPTVTITSPTGEDAHIVLEVKRNISKANIISSGSHYSSASIKVTGDGFGAILKPIISDNSLKSIDLSYKGNRYTRVPELIITDESHYGAISSVNILNSGYGYRDFPLLNIESIDGVNAEVLAFSKSIGKIKDIKFLDFAIGNTDNPMIRFPATIVMSENSQFITNEYVYVKQPTIPTDITIVPHAKIRKIDTNKNLAYVDDMSEFYSFKTENDFNLVLENYDTSTKLLHENSMIIEPGNILVGMKSQAEGTVLKHNRASGFSVMKGMGVYDLSLDKSQSLISNPSYKLHDNRKYQDYSYIIKTGIEVNKYKREVDTLLHPAGYAMYGDIKITTVTKMGGMKIRYTKKQGELDYNKVTRHIRPEEGEAPAVYSRFNSDYWRFELDKIALHADKTIPMFEYERDFRTINSITQTNIIELRTDGLDMSKRTNAYLQYPLNTDSNKIISNNQSFIFGVELSHGRAMIPSTIETMTLLNGDGTYSASGGIININFNNHGLEIGDKIALTFNTGDFVGNDATYYVSSYTDVNNFSVDVVSSDPDSYFAIINTGIGYGTITVAKITSTYHSTDKISKWVVGQRYYLNDKVHHLDSDGIVRIYFSTSLDHISSFGTEPELVKEWELYENMRSYVYDFDATKTMLAAPRLFNIIGNPITIYTRLVTSGSYIKYGKPVTFIKT